MKSLSTRIIDSHTAGEPTRVVVEGIPDLGQGSMQDRLNRFRGLQDHWRRAWINEPRGHDVLVGALLLEPQDPAHLCGTIFFNNTGTLGMCGHGTIGLISTLAYLGRIGAGDHIIETPVGDVTATLHDDGQVTVANVPAYRTQSSVVVQVPGHGSVKGQVAWGGNWFFLCPVPDLKIELENLHELERLSMKIREALQHKGITGANGAEIDHIELMGAPLNALNHGRNFVLCPGGVYDRSPCGTGTSAKLACLAADGELAPGERWRQESVIGSVFTGWYEADPHYPDVIRPFIQGRAHVTLDAQVVMDSSDPFVWGITGTSG